ncbi:MAG: Fis family transcriptional regulator [SAR86 cluster bacterium]|uniref:Fis family transcriptional regulator n=1 Tax=SAR86 cluster bacterium TaxID=2030880 RepID=A0A2A5C9F7_9GAMM|nr:XRE family transcriptional regulator [Gammaproteobacteria bacterium AH-315-E17]PCJ40215.1 MAG: Fis family transcriptional regulator [SAR86 cluster bacterium]
MNKHIGSKFDDFLNEENLLAEAQAEAIKRVVVWQLEQVMEEQKLSQTELAKRLHTSRSGLKRLLDEENTSITLNTLANVAQVTGKKLQISFS